MLLDLVRERIPVLFHPCWWYVFFSPVITIRFLHLVRVITWNKRFRRRVLLEIKSRYQLHVFFYPRHLLIRVVSFLMILFFLSFKAFFNNHNIDQALFWMVSHVILVKQRRFESRSLLTWFCISIFLEMFWLRSLWVVEYVLAVEDRIMLQVSWTMDLIYPHCFPKKIIYVITVTNL